MQHDILNTEVTTIDGETTTLAPWAGKVLLIVNVASKCGLTPQYEQLEALQKAFESEGFSVLGFPCNQFWGRSRAAKKRLKPSVAPPTASLSRCSAKLTSTASIARLYIRSWLMPPRRPSRRKAAVFMSAWPVKAGRRCMSMIFYGTLKNS